MNACPSWAKGGGGGGTDVATQTIARLVFILGFAREYHTQCFAGGGVRVVPLPIASRGSTDYINCSVLQRVNVRHFCFVFNIVLFCICMLRRFYSPTRLCTRLYCVVLYIFVEACLWPDRAMYTLRDAQGLWLWGGGGVECSSGESRYIHIDKIYIYVLKRQRTTGVFAWTLACMYVCIAPCTATCRLVGADGLA